MAFLDLDSLGRLNPESHYPGNLCSPKAFIKDSLAKILVLCKKIGTPHWIPYLEKVEFGESHGFVLPNVVVPDLETYLRGSAVL
jgi:hypothetical protein